MDAATGTGPRERVALALSGDAPCVRASKTAEVMRTHGWTHDCVSVLPPTEQSRGFRTLESDPFMSRVAMAERVAGTDADLLHVHNEPNWPVSIAKAAAGDRPVVFNVHDVTTARLDGILDPDEERAFRDADAFVFCTDAQRAFAMTAGFDIESKPWIAVPNAVPSASYVEPGRGESVGGVVYEGYAYRRGDSRVWRDLSPLADALDGLLHIYGPSDPEYGVYAGNLDYEDLLPALATHDWGLVGFHDASVPGWFHSAPNKLYDYLAAGIPFIALNLPHAAGLCDLGMGIMCSSPAEVREAARIDPAPYRRAVMRHRDDYALERYGSELAVFFDALISERAS